MKTWISAAIVALVWVGSSPSFASTLVRADLPMLTRVADTVVRGTVLKTETRWSGDRARIFTDVHLKVLETLKGTAVRTVKIVQPGGVIGDIGQTVAGMPTFKEGEEVVVFLERRGPNFVVAGMSQGKFSVERSSDGTTAFAVPSAPSDVLLVDPSTQKPTQPNPANPVSLDVFRGNVLKLIPASKLPVTPTLPVRKTGP